MKSLFYPILAGLLSAGVFLFLAWVCERMLSKVLRFTWKQEKGQYRRRIRGQRKNLLLLLLLLGVLVISLSHFTTGGPLFGLGCLVFYPFVSQIFIAYQQALQKRQLDESALAYLCVLRGQLESGIGLPVALFESAIGTGGTFSQRLIENLGRYTSGISLQSVLVRFQNKNELGEAGVFLSLLQSVYTSGLPVLPLLEAMIPRMENSLVNRKKIECLRQSLLLQAGISLLLPWLLLFVLYYFQPDVVLGFFQRRMGWAVMAVSLILQAIGVRVIWKLSEFS